VKYLYKYIYKGPNGASYSIDKSDNGGKVIIDEIKWFKDARCVTALEAAYQLYGFLYIRCIHLSFSLQHIYQVCIWWHTTKEMTYVML
jgi:hypothetical protein